MDFLSFGCSLTFGTDLQDDGRNDKWAKFSRLTWQALVSQHYKTNYWCRAKGGSGNLAILNRVLDARHHNPDNFFLISWTFIDRFDYSDPKGGHFSNGANDYLTLRPSESDEYSAFYYKRFHSEHKDKLCSLIYIKTAIDCLTQAKIPFVMTSVDDVLFDQRYHAPPAIVELQETIKPHITYFEGRNFLDWSLHRGFEISPTGHPLEQAHATAAQLMTPVIDAILHKA